MPPLKTIKGSKRQCFDGSLMVFNGDKESPFTEHYIRCPIMS